MAEERRNNTPDSQEERSPERSAGAVPQAAKKKKKRSKASLIFLLLLLAFGAGTGLHFSGMWDARPLVWEIVPQIPYIGKPVSDFFGIPEQYTLTVAERRVYEQNERQKRLDEQERDLQGRQAELDTASADIGVKLEQLSELERAMRDSEAGSSVTSEDESEKNLIAQRIRDFTTMSARNAAMIVEEMNEDLAVKILQGLNSDARAAILGKMDVRKAARLVELLSVNDETTR